MITLRRLRADHFKGLRAIDLVFPAQGSILIEGHNEAGKSTLFEAIYVALYGKPLVGEEKQAKLDDVIAFGADRAFVELTFAVGATEVTVTRHFTREKGQNPSFKITRPGAADEERHGTTAVNTRILREIGGLDGDTLRNSCFVEQKELGRLEALGKGEREAAIEHLLGLSRLSKLEESFRDSKKAAENQLREAQARYELALAGDGAQTAQQATTALRAELAAAQAAQLFTQLAAGAAQEASLAAQAATDDAARQALEARLARGEALARWRQQALSLDPLLNQARAQRARLGLSVAEREMRRQTIQQTELPARQAELADAQRRIAASASQNAALQARDQQERQRDALTEWLSVARVLDFLREFGAREAALQGDLHALQARAQQAQARLRLGQIGAGVGILLVIGGVILALIGQIVPGALALLVGLAACVPMLPLTTTASVMRQQSAGAAAELRIARSEHAVAQKAGADPQRLVDAHARLERLGMAEPASLADAQAQLDHLSTTTPAQASSVSGASTSDLVQVAARLEAQIVQLQREADSELTGDADRQRDLDRLVNQVRQQWSDLLHAARTLDLASQATEGASPEDDIAAQMADLLAKAEQQETNLNGAAARAERDALNAATGARQTTLAQIQTQRAEHQAALRALLAAHGVTVGARDLPDRTACEAQWPALAQAKSAQVADLAAQVSEAERRLVVAQEKTNAVQSARGLAQVARADLDVATCAAEAANAQHASAVSQRAGSVIAAARQQIMRQVLPVTERNMCLILPQLTAGRYHDVRLTPPDDAEGASELDYKIRVWDHTARRYVGKGIFSGGARDQCSLALRLAFALATLPQELGVAPGFLFLDEPLSAFDTERAGALVELLTTGLIAQNFAQVCVISHQHAYTHSDFRYHLRMERGRVVASDLPTRLAPLLPVPALETAAARG